MNVSTLNKLVLISIMTMAVVLPLLVRPMAAAEAAPDAQSACYQAQRLVRNALGRVTLYPAISNRLRAQPGTSGAIIGRIPSGGVFTVLDAAPQCVNGMNWWLVNYNGVVGWTAEGNGGSSYYLEPLGYVPPSCGPAPRMWAGGYGMVTPGLPNALRSAAGTGSTSVVIGWIPASATFYVVSGPSCATDGRYWWYVNYNGVFGWTAEGEGSTYWTQPIYW